MNKKMTEQNKASNNALKRTGRTSDEVYNILKEMVILFKIRPEERVNEVELSTMLGVSRTPLRQALHRLAAENMLIAVPNKGFFGRKLISQEVFDLYELRRALEISAIQLSLQRASDKDIETLRQNWQTVMQDAEAKSNLELVRDDEDFHVHLALLSGNKELASSLARINERIRFFRWIDLEERSTELYEDHLEILDALAERNTDKCETLIKVHISQRMEDIMSFIRAGVVKIYALH